MPTSWRSEVPDDSRLQRRPHADGRLGRGGRGRGGRDLLPDPGRRAQTQAAARGPGPLPESPPAAGGSVMTALAIAAATTLWATAAVVLIVSTLVAVVWYGLPEQRSAR